MYSITKGYVKSQEDTKFLIKQISSRESIYQVRNKNQSFGGKKLTEGIHLRLYIYMTQQINCSK